MKRVVMYSFSSKAEAEAKAADFKANGVRLDIFEKEVMSALCDFTKTGGGQCATDGAVWIVAGTKL